MIVAIDGPVASGKSTAARNLARALGFQYLDTGAIYRALTVLARRSATDAGCREAVRRMLASASVRLEGDAVFLDGEDVSGEIRLPEVSSSVRPLAENPDVREYVKNFERSLAAGKNVVVEGRDMATVVFPQADVKIFLTASVEERARRRWEELEARGTPQDYQSVLADLIARDKADMTRKIAPLRKAPDAIEVNTTGLLAEESASRLLAVIRDRLKGR